MVAGPASANRSNRGGIQSESSQFVFACPYSRHCRELRKRTFFPHKFILFKPRVSKMPPSMTAVRLDHISKKFGQTVALDKIDLQIKAGELFFLLGPSGCGKTTLLRLIAGLHEPTSGQIFFNDRDVTSLTTDKRNAVMCFQSYALWPHMTVEDNVGFGLDVRNVENRQARIDEVLRLVQMDQYKIRKPNQLSGGQQQRVALARALAVHPDCLLLDEPLSNLDANLRIEMRAEIQRICKSAGTTTIYVTHDQKEALAIADRLAVMKDGKIIQVGTPLEIYESPVNSFVAGFVGQTNLLPGEVIGEEGLFLRLQTPIGPLIAARPQSAPNRNVMLSLRPEHLHLEAEPGDQANQVHGESTETTFLGDSSEHIVMINGNRLRAISVPPQRRTSGPVTLVIQPRDVVIMSS
jgi:iron(III) transport system ATP-binding protein